MSIHWFPGHMQKAMRMISEQIKLVDCVLYVLDARIPASCINPYFDLAGKPIVYVLNKCDLSNPVHNAKWVSALSGENSRAVALSAISSKAIGEIVVAIKDLGSRRAISWANKGLNFTPKAMVIGVPNTGKSTVINALCGSGRTVTGNKPGVTRGKQWVRVANVLDLLDTPGTLPQKINDETVARHLAYVGSVKETVIDVADLAFCLIEELNTLDKNILHDRYDIEVADETLKTFDRICRARGFLIKGGDYDYERCAHAVLEDFRKGRMGRITLETVTDCKGNLC